MSDLLRCTIHFPIRALDDVHIAECFGRGITRESVESGDWNAGEFEAEYYVKDGVFVLTDPNCRDGEHPVEQRLKDKAIPFDAFSEAGGGLYPERRLFRPDMEEGGWVQDDTDHDFDPIVRLTELVSATNTSSDYHKARNLEALVEKYSFCGRPLSDYA